MASSSRISRVPLLLLFSTSQLISQVLSFQQCYFPDGSIPNDLLWTPTKADGQGHSACCDSRSGDIGQPNGLCLWTDDDTKSTYRGTCTDRTWKDPACPKLCLDGEEDDWLWTTPCASKSDGSDLNYICGFREKSNNQRVAANCTLPATKYASSFVTTQTTSSKATRYTPPPSLDPKLFSVFVETYVTKVTALGYTTLTTTWESTIVSEIGVGILGTASSTTLASQTGSSKSGITSTDTQTGQPDATNSSEPQTTPSPTPPPSPKPSPAIIGGAVGGVAVLAAVLAGLFFFLRKKRAASNGSRRIDSPPPNGPVGKDQVTPYEVSGADAAGGAFVPEKQHVYGNGGAYEMSSAGEKGWGNGNANAVEVASGDQRVGAYEMAGVNASFQGSELDGRNQQYANQHQTQNQYWAGAGQGNANGNDQSGEVSRNGPAIISPMTPAPVYGLMPSRAGAVEMDGSDYAPSRPTTATGSVRGRNGVGNA